MACACTEHIDDQLIHCIRYHQHAKVTSMLSKDPNLINASDCRGTLLHHAVINGNFEITRLLISLGISVNCRGKDGETPLMIAIQYNYESIIKVLLEAGADVYVANVTGHNSLHMIKKHDPEIIELVLFAAKVQTPMTQELIERLLAAGLSFPYFAILNDVDVLEELMQRGFDVNSKYEEQKTALHRAVRSKAFESARLLIDRGADVNALDSLKCNPLYFAAYNLDLDTMRLLLDHGADPDPQDVEKYECLPLYACIMAADRDDDNTEQVRECAELLLQHGALPGGPQGSYDLVFEIAYNWGDDIFEGSWLNCLVAHQAMLDELKVEEKNVELEVDDGEEEMHLTAHVELKGYYDKCRLIVKTAVVGTTSVLDLLEYYSHHEMRRRARNQTFVCQVEQFCTTPKLRDSFPYYANILEKRITEAARIVKLENKGIYVICDIFNCHYNQFSFFAREVVGYLSESDLEQLCRV